MEKFILKSGKARIKRRLEYLRQEIRLERLSSYEMLELTDLQKFIAKDDIELLQWARPGFEDDLESEEIEAYKLLNYNSIQNVYTKETIEISDEAFEKMYTSGKLHFYPVNRNSQIDHLISSLSDLPFDDKGELMKQDLELLMNMDDEYIFSSTSTNEYICSTDPEFIQTCKDLIVLNNSFNA